MTANLIVSSPPYEGNEKADYLLSEDGKTRARDLKRGFRQGHGCFRGSEGAYGQSAGQLGTMRHGEPPPPHEVVEVNTDAWQGCYDSGWKGLIVEGAFAHPAKYARGLISRIYRHASECGWIVPGNVVVDPFGGVALGALDAMMHGCRWIGVELEGRFHGLGNENLAAWQARWGRTTGWGSAVLLQGDSRRLCEVVMEEAAAVVCSPPYVSGGHHTDVMGAWNANGGGHGVVKDEAGYGKLAGQLGSLREGDADAVVSSPPFENSMESWDKQSHIDFGKCADGRNVRRSTAGCQGLCSESYGVTEGQVGLASGETFWSAARIIVEQCFMLLRHGGHAVWVLKDFVRNGAVVPFCDQWRRLCEAIGFVTLHCHRAMLVKDLGEEADMFGPPVKKTRERKSFFRRLAEKKGSPRIDWEVVLCMAKE